MNELIDQLLIIHIIAGFTSLVTGLISILSLKGGKIHKKSGKIYFYSMTIVFVTAIIIASYRFNRFLFLIAFLSYYSAFAGVRKLKLKNLHKNQKPKWYDWTAGIINGIANLFFIGLGIYYSIENGFFSGGALLSVGFGIGGLLISYVNLKPFIIKPNKSYHWYLSHIGNMFGGYIATSTAFLSTLISKYEIMNPFLGFALPSIIGVPLLIYWMNKTEKTFKK
tara:strand:- start:94 stop:762 length:669 start_codon:yes stop_codon:yes gene_type:complete